MSRDQRIDQSAKFKTTVRGATYLMMSHVSLALWTLTVKSTVKIWKNFVAFSEYINFNGLVKVDRLGKGNSHSSIFTLMQTEIRAKLVIRLQNQQNYVNTFQQYSIISLLSSSILAKNFYVCFDMK